MARSLSGLFCFLTLFWGSVLFIPVSAQTSDNTALSLPKVIPPSPEASALGKFGETPVSLYTGVPEINIPIYSIAFASGFALPISLSYHAGGNRVDEIASNVGLGWSLNAGGVITCTVNDNPDLGSTYEVPEPGTFTPSYSGDQNSDYVWANRMLGGIGSATGKDLQPDEFYYNFFSQAGKFVLDVNRKAHTIPHQKLDINYKSGGFFEVIDEVGNKYVFADLEVSRVSSTCNSDEIQPDFPSSFYLSQVVTPSKDTIRFEYTAVSYSYFQSVSETKKLGDYIYTIPGSPNMPASSYVKCLQTNIISGKRLSKIRASNGVEVIFDYNQAARYGAPHI